jgi:hypothetical protein
MSESMTNAPFAVRPRHGWLTTTTVGVSLVALAMIALALVMLDKSHFGWMVGTYFLEIISVSMMLGGFVVVLGTLFLPERNRWRGMTLLFWGLVALTSPAFGMMLFLLPWGVLALTLPLIIAILRKLFRTSANAVA